MCRSLVWRGRPPPSCIQPQTAARSRNPTKLEAGSASQMASANILQMSPTTTESPVPSEHSAPERPERKRQAYLFTEKQVADKSEIARRFLDTRARLNANVDKANNLLVKRLYNIDHNAYLEGTLPAKTKELMGLVASAVLRCDDCIFYHAIQAYRLGVPRPSRKSRSTSPWSWEVPS